MDRAVFFDAIRNDPFSGLAVKQVSGTEAILDGWQARGGGRRQWLSYMLATAFHETATTMQPIHEYGGDAYFTKRYDPPAKVAAQLGNVNKGDGARFHGRGYVQLTGRRNYQHATDALMVDFIADPDLALEPQHAADIMFLGMKEGWFTGKKLEDFLNARESDWENARRIVNGTDRAKIIAGYARKFDAAILAAVAQPTT